LISPHPYYNEYVATFVAGISFYTSVALFIIEKIKKKLLKNKRKHDEALRGIYGTMHLSIDETITSFDSLYNSRNEHTKVKSLLFQNSTSGIIFITGCVVGIIFRITNNKEGIALMLLFLGFSTFFMSLLLLLYWYIKN